MARYRPSQYPIRDPDESAEDYLDKLLPWLRDEFDGVYRSQEEFEVPTATDRVRAPVASQLVFFPNGSAWKPANISGWYLWGTDGFWYRINITKVSVPN